MRSRPLTEVVCRRAEIVQYELRERVVAWAALRIPHFGFLDVCFGSPTGFRRIPEP